MWKGASRLASHIIFQFFPGFGSSQGLPKWPVNVQGRAARAAAALTARSSAPSWVCGLALPTRAPPSFTASSRLYFILGSPTASHAATTKLILIQELTQALRDATAAAPGAHWLPGGVLLVEGWSSNPSAEKQPEKKWSEVAMARAQWGKHYACQSGRTSGVAFQSTKKLI